jgi:phosphohistidine phosphatase
MSTNGSKPLKQAAAIPYRCRNGKPEFCLITSVRRGNWGFPKGIIDPGETAAEAALKEALEEAGLHGEIEGTPLGRFEYEKWGQILPVTVFLMRVDQADDTWDEAKVRKRRWSRADEARELIERAEFRECFETALQRIPCCQTSK